MTTEPSPAAEEPSLPDDVWEQFANDSERAIRATAPKEPSARARIVARRLREQDERPDGAAGARRWGRRPKPHTPSQHAAAWRPDNRPPKPPPSPAVRRLRAFAGVVLVVAVVLFLLAPSHAWSWITG
ncbi:MAG: hypothetical protein HOY69_23820 [Streptomyces sp.]|nr:hypothetical protein [Streptomyces sp.]